MKRLIIICTILLIVFIGVPLILNAVSSNVAHLSFIRVVNERGQKSGLLQEIEYDGEVYIFFESGFGGGMCKK